MTRLGDRRPAGAISTPIDCVINRQFRILGSNDRNKVTVLIVSIGKRKASILAVLFMSGNDLGTREPVIAV